MRQVALSTGRKNAGATHKDVVADSLCAPPVRDGARVGMSHTKFTFSKFDVHANCWRLLAKSWE